MWIGNLLLVVLNLPLVGVWVRLLRVPYRWLFPSIIMFCCVGNYSVSNNPVDVYLSPSSACSATSSSSSNASPRRCCWATCSGR